MDDYVWVIGGGLMQIPLIRTAQARGFGVVVSDRNPDAEGARIADCTLGIDTYDIEAHVRIAESIKGKKNIVGVLPGGDVGPTVSAVADILDLPAESLAVAKAARNKAEFRKRFDQGIIFMEVACNEEAPQSRWRRRCASAGIDAYPCVVKPLESSATRGITLVDSPWKMLEAIKYASRHSKNRFSNVLIEEYLPGCPEVAMDFFMIDGKLHFANAAYRIFRAKHKFGFEIGHINPWQPTPEVIKLAKKAAEALGVTYGPFKADLIFSEKYQRWIILEVATRLSGGFDHMYSCPLATGKDIVGMLLDMALGTPYDASKLKMTKRNQYACIYAPTLIPGKVTKWDLGRAKKMPGVADIFVTGNEIPFVENCASRTAFVMTSDTSEFGAFRKAVEASKQIGVKYL